MPKLIWVFAGCTLILLVLSCRGLLVFLFDVLVLFCIQCVPYVQYTRRLQKPTTSWAASWQNQQNDCAPSKDSDQPGHSPSLIRVFTVRMKKAWVLSYPLSAQRRFWSDCPVWSVFAVRLKKVRIVSYPLSAKRRPWSDWADAQADLSLRWAHMPFCLFCHDVAHFLKLQYISTKWDILALWEL